MVRLTRASIAAAALAVAAVALPGSPARAFTFETLGGGADGGSRYADPDGQTAGNGGVRLFGSNGPMVQFNAGQGVAGPYLGPMSPLQGFSSGPPPPQPYGPRSLGNND